MCNHNATITLIFDTFLSLYGAPSALSNTRMEDIHRSQYRLPNALYERLRDAAKQRRRSINSELVERLEASFAEPQRAAPAVDISKTLQSLRLADVLTADELEAVAARIVSRALKKI